MATPTRWLVLGGAAILAYSLFWPVPIDPVAWQPAPNPGIVPNRALTGIQNLSAGPGPEAVAVSAGGWLYTGLQDGRIVRMHADGMSLETFAQTGGRPLGMKFDRTGNLIVADAFRGLLSVAPDRTVTVLAGGMLFVNDLAIAADGVIWFSDSSQRFDQHHWMHEFWEAQPTGRLLRYDPAARTVSVAVDHLLFANGVALGPGDDFVLVDETLAARITRYWLHGPKAGQTDTFVSALPGYPDNLTFDGRTFWVALPSPRVPALERMARLPWLRRILFHIPEMLRDPKPGRMAWVLGLDPQGRIVRDLQDPSKTYGPVTSVVASGGRFYFGSIDTEAIGWIAIP